MVRTAHKFIILLTVSHLTGLGAPLGYAHDFPNERCLLALHSLFRAGKSEAIFAASAIPHPNDFKALLQKLPPEDPVRSFLAKHDFQEAAWSLAERGKKDLADQFLATLDQQMRTAKPYKATPVHQGTAQAQKITLEGEITGVFKPYPEHYPDYLPDGAKASSPISEVLAYRFDQALGTNLVPMTVERTFGKIRGSFQIWVKQKENAFIVPEDQARRLAIFDYLICNSDRHMENIIQTESRLAAIDNGLAFRKNPFKNSEPLERPRVIFKRGPLPEEMAAKIRDQLTPEFIRSLLGGKIDPNYVEKVLERREELLQYHDHFKRRF